MPGMKAQAMLGFATVSELLNELIARFEVPLAGLPMTGPAADELKAMCGYLPPGVLDYWTANPDYR